MRWIGGASASRTLCPVSAMNASSSGRPPVSWCHKKRQQVSTLLGSSIWIGLTDRLWPSQTFAAPALAKSQKLLRAVNPAGCQRVIEDAHLGEQSGLIPIEMLVGDFAALELDNAG
jgi:hypothetical protein